MPSTRRLPGCRRDAPFILGPALNTAQTVDAIDALVDAYLRLRTSGEERFLDTYRRVGLQPFKEAVYAAA